MRGVPIRRDLTEAGGNVQAARAQLASLWDQFAAPDRATCAQNETSGGTPSYVELLTCLQMSRDARSLPESKTDGTNR